MSPFDSWLLVVEVAALVWLYWRIVNWALDLIAHRSEDASAGRSSGEAMSATRERDH